VVQSDSSGRETIVEACDSNRLLQGMDKHIKDEGKASNKDR
jgi:hypothetical protein